jgi:putative tryptophan/tyrosine transport system substrate-binding protein
MNKENCDKNERAAHVRLFLGILCLLLMISGVALPSHADTVAKLRILVIKTRDVSFYAPALQGLMNGLKQRGYKGSRIEVKTFALTGNPKSDLELVQTQLSRRPDLIVTLGSDATRLVAEQKSNIPVLFTMILDPVSLGVVKSLAEPGGNFTGSTLLVSPGKQFDTLLQSCPKARRIGVLFTENDPTSMAFLKEAQEEAQRLSIELHAVAVKPGQASKDALQQFKGSVDALWLIPDPASTGIQEMKDTLEFARTNRLPILGASSATVRAGALTALSANLEDLGDVTAEMAVRILEGTDSPAKMRVRGPRRTQLTLNLDSARLLKFSLPDALLSLADEVIDSQNETPE